MSAEETLAVALSLARRGDVHVFPLAPDGDPRTYGLRWDKGPEGERATTDPDVIKRWFLVDFPDAVIGVHAGLSGLVVVDLDAKHGKDGAAALEAAGRSLPSTFSYPSHSGTGSHHWYRAPGNADLTIAKDVLGMPGVDIRSGVGYARYAGPLLERAPKLAKAPAWSLVRRGASERASGSPGDLQAWLSAEAGRKPRAHHRLAVEAVPVDSDALGHHDLLGLCNDVVAACLDGRAREWSYQRALERWTAHPDGDRRDFETTFAKAVAGAPAPLTRTLPIPKADRPLPTVRHLADPDRPELQLTIRTVGELAEWKRRRKKRQRKAGEGSTWSPVKLGRILDGILDGSLERETPTVLSRSGTDSALFYAGRVNGVHGESGCGKSWTALLAAAQEVVAGRPVLYLDLEDSAEGIVQRLVDLGVSPAAVRSRFLYVSPDGPYDEAAERVVRRLVRKRGVSLVVVDSTGEALAADGAAPNDDDDVARWFRRVPRRIARLGPAVVVLDHSPKATDLSTRLFPIGSHRKRAAVDGAQYLQEAAVAFSRDTAGWAKLIAAKDRHGTFARGEHVASLHVTPHGSGVHVELVAPPKVAPVDKRAALMERVSRYLEDMPDVEPSVRSIRENVGANAADVAEAIRALVVAGHVAVRQAGQAQRHRLVTRFRASGTATTFPIPPGSVPSRFPPKGVGTAEPVEPRGSETGSEPVGTTTEKEDES